MSNPKHPIITFTVKLDRFLNEKIGPNTNQRSTNVLHPDMHDNDEDRGRTNSAQHDALKSTFLPGLLAGENVIQNDDGTITAYGMKAKYLLDTYATGDEALLTVVSNTSESESP